MMYDLDTCPECTVKLEFFEAFPARPRVNITHQPDCPYKIFNKSLEEAIADFVKENVEY